MAKDQRMEKVVAELRRRIAALEDENQTLKTKIHRLKAPQAPKSRPGGCC